MKSNDVLAQSAKKSVSHLNFRVSVSAFVLLRRSISFASACRLQRDATAGDAPVNG